MSLGTYEVKRLRAYEPMRLLTKHVATLALPERVLKIMKKTAVGVCLPHLFTGFASGAGPTESVWREK